MAGNIISEKLVVYTDDDNEYVFACGLERCGKIGYGILRLESTDDQTTASLELTGAGCDVCHKVNVSEADLGAVDDFTRGIPSDNASLQTIRIMAQSRLGLVVQALPIERTVQSQPFIGQQLEPSDFLVQ
jgi:hypothetical protein